MKSVWFLMICLVGILWTSSCYTCKEDEECPEDIACTEVFVTVSIPLVFSNLSIGQLAFSTTVLKETGQELHRHEYNKPFDMGPYFAPVVDDLNLPGLKKSGSVVILTIFDKSGKNIYETECIVGHDCCHVLKISGPEKINL